MAPVAIVGAGADACGLVAALSLRDAGAECVALERDALPSGSTALSSGFIPAGGTRCQRVQRFRRQPRTRAPAHRRNRRAEGRTVTAQARNGA